MSVLAIVLIVLAAIVLLFFVGGLAYSRRRLMNPALEEHIREADQALAQARAHDKGWDRDLLHDAARAGLAQQRPDFDVGTVHLVLVDDKPGVEEDRAHMLASGRNGQARVILARNSAGEWILERIE